VSSKQCFKHKATNPFSYSQIIGFILVLFGALLFNNIFFMQFIKFCKTGKWPKGSKSSEACQDSPVLGTEIDNDGKLKQQDVAEFEESKPSSKPQGENLDEKTVTIEEVSEAK
jgi:hypothetical protein